MRNGQLTGAQNNLTTEDGAYTLKVSTPNLRPAPPPETGIALVRGQDELERSVRLFHPDSMPATSALLTGQGKYSHWRIDFQQGGNKSVVHNPHNKVRFCFGGPPEEARVEGNLRILVFRHGVILKTWVDDLEFSKEGIGLGGWMGVGREHGELQVSQRGEFQDP